MAHNIHDLGDLVTVRGAWNVPGTSTAVDPQTAKLSVRTPAGAVTTYVYGVDAQVLKDSVGRYHASIDANEPGMWFYRWWSTGSGQAADEQRFEIRKAQAV